MNIRLSEALTAYRKRNNLSLPQLDLFPLHGRTATGDTDFGDNKQQLECDQSMARSSLAPTNYTTNTGFELSSEVMGCPSPKSMMGQDDMLAENVQVCKQQYDMSMYVNEKLKQSSQRIVRPWWKEKGPLRYRHLVKAKVLVKEALEGEQRYEECRTAKPIDKIDDSKYNNRTKQLIQKLRAMAVDKPKVKIIFKVTKVSR